eukprot:TRINITY_DN21024_c0_g1_i2.p2 TRINITY_DN21024_c0_g1~~TRINITY_DN21024_c0_g1_i2.p2  ORF type:complete len:317 (+),score=55.24 TRINITY_DN21024_c0_g1_i2:139-1089(+)
MGPVTKGGRDQSPKQSEAQSAAEQRPSQEGSTPAGPALHVQASAATLRDTLQKSSICLGRGTSTAVESEGAERYRPHALDAGLRAEQCRIHQDESRSSQHVAMSLRWGSTSEKNLSAWGEKILQAQQQPPLRPLPQLIRKPVAGPQVGAAAQRSSIQLGWGRQQVEATTVQSHFLHSPVDDKDPSADKELSFGEAHARALEARSGRAMESVVRPLLPNGTSGFNVTMSGGLRSSQSRALSLNAADKYRAAAHATSHQRPAAHSQRTNLSLGHDLARFISDGSQIGNFRHYGNTDLIPVAGVRPVGAHQWSPTPAMQ